MNRTRFLNLVLLGAFCLAAGAGLTNPGFEAGLEGWQPQIGPGMGEVTVEKTPAGNPCAHIRKTAATKKFSAVGLVREVAVDPAAVYEISLRCRAVLTEKPVGWAFRVFLRGNGPGKLYLHRSITPDPDWHAFTWRFNTLPGTTAVTLSILLTYSAGDAWVDDVGLRKIGGSVEAEAFPARQKATIAAVPGFSAGKGIELPPGARLETTLPLDRGAVRIQVFGTGKKGAGLCRRAVVVRLGNQRMTADVHPPGSTLHGRSACFQIDAPGKIPLVLERQPDYPGPLVLDRITWSAHDGPGRPAPLVLDTPIAQAGRPQAVIVAPRTPELRRFANRLRKRIRERFGAGLKIVDDTEWMAGDPTGENAIAVGNMLQNKLTERLYCLWYTFEDGWYPGPGGWVVRTVHNPWGTGRNVVVLAGSDAAGAARAADRFMDLLGTGKNASIGHTIQVKMAPAVAAAVWHPTPEYARRSLPRRSQRNLMNSAARCGTAYAHSGDRRCVEAFRIFLLEHKRRPELGHDTHMELWKTIRAWDNVEECPVFSPADRLEITNYLLRVLRSDEGVNQGMFRSALAYSSVRHNHQMLAAMDAYYGGRYFTKYYALPEAKDWLRMARFCFASQELQDKGQDESGNYEGSTALRPLLPYAYTEPGYRFLPGGTAKRFIDRCCLAIDNRFASSGHGDCWDVDCFPTLALAIGAWYYRDAGYQYLLEQRWHMRPKERNRMQIQPPFRLDGYLAPKRPARFEGIRVAPLNPEHYAFFRKRQEFKWNVPCRRTFDKLSFRTRFEKDKQYLLLDGISCGSHGHFDANCLIRFTDNGRVWLVDDSYTEGPFPEDHNAVLVARDGLGETLPACARLDGVVESDTAGITRTTLPDYSGVDWERNIFWLEEKCFVVIDRMTARKAGNYSFRGLWRTLGTATLENDRLVTRQICKTPERDDRMVIVCGSGVALSIRPASEDFNKRWNKYAYARPLVNVLSQSANRRLKPGEDFSFANLFYAANTASPLAFDLTRIGPERMLVSGSKTAVVGLADDGVALGGLNLRAGGFILEAHSLVAVQATALSLDGIAVLQTPEPVSLDLRQPDGRLVLRVSHNVTATVLGKPRPLEPGRHEFPLGTVRAFAPELGLARKSAGAKASRQPAVDTDKAETAPEVPAIWTFESGSDIRAVTSDNGRIFAGTAGGEVLSFAPGPKLRWRAKMGGTVNAVAAGDLDGNGKTDWVAAAETGEVKAWDPDGKALWTFRCPPYPKRGGKKGQARDLLVADLDGDGAGEVVVGANNIKLHILDGNGKERRTFAGSDPKMTFTNFSALDTDGDGKLEVFAFPDSGSFGSCLEFILDGRQIRFGTDGWPSHIRDRVAVDLDGDGATDFACGTNRGNLYFLRNRKKMTTAKAYAFGCAVTAMAGIERPPRPALLAVGVDMGYVHVLDGTAARLWSRPVGEQATGIVFLEGPAGPQLAVGTAAGTVLFFDAAGNTLGRSRHPAPVRVVTAMGNDALVAYADGALRLLRIEDRARQK